MNAKILFPPLPAPTEMAAWDRAAIALGLPEAMLMENAARAAFDALAEAMGRQNRAKVKHEGKKTAIEAVEAPPTCKQPMANLEGADILLFMGGGNNGGDAACLARHLLDAGARPLVLHTKPLGRYKGAAAKHIDMARSCGVLFVPAAKLETVRRGKPAPWIVVDGLLGTGLSGPVKTDTLNLIREINRLGQSCFVLALDIPSGLDGLAGKPLPEAVRADMTVTFQAAKPGLLAPGAAEFTGRLEVRPIGIPLKVQTELLPARRLLDARGCARLLPHPRAGAHKGVFGHTLIAGGSPGLTGAPHLAALAALRGGAGLATIAAPAGLCSEIKGNNPNIMTLPLPCGDNWDKGDLTPLLQLMTNCRGLAVGPGMGRSAAASGALREILAMENRPAAVIDADALFALAEFSPSETDALIRESDILTPHPGEAARLLNISPSEVQDNREGAALALAEKYPAHIVLKGAGSILVRRGGVLYFAPHDEPRLAVAGSGDVLAGCIAALLAAGADSFSAAACGIMLHIIAGQMLGREFPARGNLASEIADRLPKAKQLLEANLDVLFRGKPS